MDHSAGNELSHAGSVVDKAIEYMIAQGIGEVAIASALLGGSLTLLSRSMPDDAIVQVLNNAISSVRSGELRDTDATGRQGGACA
jgi:hypothetical protein